MIYNSNLNIYTSEKIRDAFQYFFIKNNHVLYSPSYLTKADTTLFTVAGMQQFRRYFLGLEKAPDNAIITIQPCLRVGGNKCDLENIGETSRHSTLFEMGGNFSFGAYFNEKAIPLAYQFLTEVLQFDKDKLFFTTHISDHSSYDIWNKIAPGHVLALDSDDNFWTSGSYGPCGPCTEIFFCKEGGNLGDFKHDLEHDNVKYLEIWNIVLISFNMTVEGLIPLENKYIDTGFGLERMTAIYNYTHNIMNETNLDILDNYSTDLLSSIYNTAYKQVKNIKDAKILADHSRAIVFLLNENLLPGKSDKEYVLRKLIRRIAIISDDLEEIFHAVYQRYNIENKYYIVQKELDLFSEAKRNALEYLEKTVLDEYCAFKLYETYGMPLEVTYDIAKHKGIKLNTNIINEYLKEHSEKSKKMIISVDKPTQIYCYDQIEIDAKIIDIIQRDDKYIILTDKSCFYAEGGGQAGDIGTFEKHVYFDQMNKEDRNEINKLMKKRLDLITPHVDKINQISDDIHNKSKEREKELDKLIEDIDKDLDHLSVEYIKERKQVYQERIAKIDEYINKWEDEINKIEPKIDAINKVYDQESDKFREKIQIENTLKHVISFNVYAVLHITSDIKSLQIGERIYMRVNKKYRDANMRAHSSIHLTIEPIIRSGHIPTGSSAKNDEFRWDIMSNEKIDIKFLEQNANKAIMESIQSKVTYEKYEEIKDCVLLDGCTYGEEVRVVEFPGYSKQLCGGTHVINTSEIQKIIILKDKSLGVGLRRIEGICGKKALEYNQNNNNHIQIKKEISEPQEVELQGVKGLYYEYANLKMVKKYFNNTFIIFNDEKTYILCSENYQNIIQYFQNKGFYGGGKGVIQLGNKQKLTLKDLIN